MATDRSLASLLRALQDASSEQDVSRLLGSATSLLILLSNPLNVTLLSAQLLSAPAIWSRPDGLRTVVQVMGIFNSATIQVLQREVSVPNPTEPVPQKKLVGENWILAVIRGADDRSPRWKHVILLGGLLLGSVGKDRQAVSNTLRRKLEGATIKALNLSLEQIEAGPELAVNGIVVTLGHIFSHLSDTAKHVINFDQLLPHLWWSPFCSPEGLHFGYFLSTMDADIVEESDMKFHWSKNSSSYIQVQIMASSPILASLGSVSRVLAYSMEHARDPELLSIMVSNISAFSRSLCIQWRQNKLSEIDLQEESTFLSPESRLTSLPLLWRILNASMFSIVVILRSLLERLLGDSEQSVDSPPFIAKQTLQTLRSLYFISSRLGDNAFSQYNFVYLTAIDILSQYPVQAKDFLQGMRSAKVGLIPKHPLDRCHDLYFLNTLEHFPSVLTTNVNEELLIGAATPYLGIGGDQRLIEIFEAAHSVMLGVFSAPQNSELVSRHIYNYVNALFMVFPQNLSSRQFRIAMKTLVRVTSPPFLVSVNQPTLSSTLLELVRKRFEESSQDPLPHPPISCVEAGTGETSESSEQAVMILTLIDSLPYLSESALEEWLPIVAETLNFILDEATRSTCQQRFWEVLSNGEMDVDRAALCVWWWSTMGGKEMVFPVSKTKDNEVMSSGLGTLSKL